MPRVIYDPKTKAAILKAAKGKPLPEAHQAAKAAGYKGGLPSLYIMLRKSGVIRRKRRGRLAVKGGSAASTPAADGLSPINEMVERIVRERVRVVLDRAIDELKKVQ